MHEPCDFLCDAMLGGLARWLRAAGYDARFDVTIDDDELIRLARRSGAVLLSSDGGIFKRTIVRDGTVRAVHVPPGLSRQEQLAHVLRCLVLPLRDGPRCMACGGELAAVEKPSVRDEAPPRAYMSCDEFWRCARCGKLFWRGTHWQRISRRLRELRL